MIFHEKLNRIFLLSLALALTGALLIMGSDFLLHPRLGIGDLMASCAAIFFASYMLSTQQGMLRIDPLRYSCLVGITASITMFVINLLLHNIFIGYDT